MVSIRRTETSDWHSLKYIRLEALRDAPTAFGVSYNTAILYPDERWHELASSDSKPKYWLAFDQDNPIGMIGLGVDQDGEFNLIGMWVHNKFRGKGIAELLVNEVKMHAINQRAQRVILSVSPQNISASKLYIKQGFMFINEYEALASHPEITLQFMEWVVDIQSDT